MIDEAYLDELIGKLLHLHELAEYMRPSCRGFPEDEIEKRLNEWCEEYEKPRDAAIDELKAFVLGKVNLQKS